MHCIRTAILLSLFVVSKTNYAQDSTAHANIQIPPKYFEAVSQKANDLKQKIDEKTDKYLAKLKKQEEKLYKKLFKKDSIAAKQIFGDIEERYNSLQAKSLEQAKKLTAFSQVYSSKLDSLTTAFNFLNNTNLLSPELQVKLKDGLRTFNDFQQKLNQADQIKRFLRERKKLITEQLGRFGLVKELKQFNKQIFYYQQQINEFKELWENPAKVETKVMELLVSIPSFKEFFSQNSQLAGLFRLPGSTSNNLPNAMAGLQTRATVQQNLIDRLGSGADVQRLIQENLQTAQGQVNQLKNELNQRLPKGGGSDEELPDFKANSQKTKSFIRRLEVGTNFQTQKASNIYPTSTDFGFSLGYKLNDKNLLGVGFSYRIGWGTGWNNIRISHQGIGVRSFIDIKISKSNFFFSGGYEQNYRAEIRDFDQLKDQSAWQKSGLLGLSRSISVKSKILKRAKMYALWDFLSYDQTPKSTPLVLRIGYSFK